MNGIYVGKFRRMLTIGGRIIFGYLALNSVGNFASSATPERRILASILAIVALCAFRLNFGKNQGGGIFNPVIYP